MKHRRAALRAAVGICAALAWMATAAPARAAQDLSYTDILRQLTDLDRLTHLQTGTRGGLFSSWDRGSYTYWGANGDAAQYLRVEPNGEAVMMDIDGPGCVYRLWSANPMGKLRVYLDGATEPTYEWDFPQLFTGTIPPFVKPLVWQRDGPQSASDCYLPIPFARHIKVTADKAHGQYYQLNYLLFPKDTRVASFHLPLSQGEEVALEAAATAWAHPGRDPKPSLPGQTTIAHTFTIHPGQTLTLADIRRSGVIRAIRVRASSAQRYYWRKLVLKGTWDDAAWPQVLTPLGPLFGFDWDTPEYGSLIAGCQGGQCYFHYPMPFRSSGKLQLTSRLEQPAKVTFEVDWAPVKKQADDMVYFFARWRQEPGPTEFDYPFLETAGHGHFVGVAMPIDHPLPGWWGEGDEKVWVDDDFFPPWIGTGSEDYFGDAWGIRYLPGPSWGCASFVGHRTCNYRWHFMDLVPFEKRFRMTIENYGPNGAGPRGQYDYSSTALWYQAELVPPFDQLKGQVYVGGDRPDQKPEPCDYHGNLFTDLDAAAVRTYGLAIPFAFEAEDLLQNAVSFHKARIITDAKLPYEFNRERAVYFGKVKAGQVLDTFTLPVPSSAVYFPVVYTAPGAAAVTLELQGRRLDVTGPRGPSGSQLGGVRLTKGNATLRLVALTEGQGIVDCFQLETVPHEQGAIEAEDLQVVRVRRGSPQPQVSTPLREASGGAYLWFRGTRAGQSMTLRMAPVPSKPYSLGIRPMMGPSAAIVQAFVGGKAAGPRFDLYAPQPRRGDTVLPVGPVPANGEVEFRAVAKNRQSTGFEIGIDYLRYEPRIIGPDTADGVWARVLAVRGAGYSIQDFGDPWFGGHHLWIQPSSHDATADVALQVPRDGDYELVVRYTTSWDYASVQASLDGKPLGDAVNCYTPDVRLREPVSLGTVHLTRGQHVVQFKAVDKDPASRGYLMGINYITLKPAK